MISRKPFAQILWESRFSSYARRQEATELIQDMKGIEAISWLLAALDDEEEFVRHRANNTIRRIMYKSTLDELLNYVIHPHPTVRILAIFGLRPFEGKEKQTALLHCISDADESVAQAAITIIGESTAPPISGLQKLFTATAPSIRSRAAAALDEINKPERREWVPTPEYYPRPKSPGYKQPSWQVFEQILKNLENPKLSVRLAAIAQLIHFREGSAFDLLLRLRSDPECRIRAHVAKALGSVNDARATEVLITMTNDPVRCVKHAAVCALGNCGDLALSRLLQLLQEGDTDLQALALEAMAKLQPSDVWTAVFEKLESAQKIIRFKAAQVLSFWSLPEVVDALIGVLKDIDHSGRIEAAYALGRTGSPTAVAPLCQALKDPNPDLRRQAAESLGMLRRQSAWPALEAALSDEDWRVAHMARKALVKLDKQRPRRKRKYEPL